MIQKAFEEMNSYFCAVEDAKEKLVECRECGKPFMVPVKAEVDEAIICSCQALLFLSDYQCCEQGYTITYTPAAFSLN